MTSLVKDFAVDVIPRHCLRMGIVRSKYAHANFTIPDQEYKNIPGVIQIITAQDVPGELLVGSLIPDQPVLAVDKARYVGEAITLLIVEPNVQLEELVEHFQVNYDELPCVLSIEEAQKRDAISVHPSGNLLMTRRIRRGNANNAFKDADVTVEGDYKVGWLEHAYLEPEAGYATVSNGCVEVYYPTQCPHYARSTIAKVLALEESSVRIIPTKVGGGFGGKLEVMPMCHLALAAFLSNTTVSLTFSRMESMSYTTKSHPINVRYKIGATADGLLVAAKVSFQLDTGAYASYGPGVLTRAAIHALGPYHVPNFEIEGQLFYTNNPIAGAMRGFGQAQITFACERQMDLVAKKLQMSPFELRLKNAFDYGSKTATGHILNFDVGLKQCIQKAKELSSHFAVTSGKIENFSHGKGVATFFYGIGNTEHANPAIVSIELDSALKFLVRASTINMGQAPSVMLTKIVARELGTSVQNVQVMPVDTAITPDSGVTSASRTTFYVGNAARLAAVKLRDLIIKEARNFTSADGLVLDLNQGTIVDRCTKKSVIHLTELIQYLAKQGRTLVASATFSPQVTTLDPQNGNGSPYATYSFGCHVAEVCVDMETYEIEVTHYCAIHDSGSIIDYKTATSQVHGGIAMGIGLAMLEQGKVEDGRFISNSFRTYNLPKINNMPSSLQVHFVETYDSSGPFGAKGLAEPALVPVAAAVVNAICDAVGMDINSLPIRPEDIWRKLRGSNAHS